MNFIYQIIILLLILASVLYLFAKYKFTFWAARNIAFIEPCLPYGNIEGLGTKHQLSQLLHKFYKKLKGNGPIGGFYCLLCPFALALDLDLIKNIFIRDFSHFQERGFYFNQRDDPLSAHLFTLEGPQWKILRRKLSPTFTSSKMKFIFLAGHSAIVEMRELFSRYSTDIILKCVLGISDTNSEEQTNKFVMLGKKEFQRPRLSNIASLLLMSFRSLGRRLRIKAVHDDVAAFVMEVITEAVKYREANKINRNDFMELLIQLKNKGRLSEEEGETVGTISIEEIAAQALLFFLAGFDSSSSSLSYTFHELACNPLIQTKARTEINMVLQKYNGELTYEAMMEMKYCDTIINESLRKYPPGAYITRMVTKDYVISGAKITLSKGSMVIIPVYSIHHDAEYYPDPEKFDPNRFLPEQEMTRHPMAYIPFGEGPRNCIGLRLGLMQVKLAMITMIRSFHFKCCSKTVIPIEFAKSGLVLEPEGGVYMSVTKILK